MMTLILVMIAPQSKEPTIDSNPQSGTLRHRDRPMTTFQPQPQFQGHDAESAKTSH